MPSFSQVEIFQRIRAQLGEGPCWHAGRQTLWWIDILGKKLFEARLNGTTPRRLGVDQLIGAVVPARSGSMVAALRDGIYLLNPDTGETTLFAQAPGHDPKDFRFNDAKVDPQGRLWAGTLALDGRRGQSHLYRIEADRSVVTMRDGISVSNGLAWTPDGQTLYYVDSPTRTVQAFAFDSERGTLGSPRVVITLSDADGYPDGCSMDVEGCLWLAHWGGGKLTRWEPASGRLLATFSFPVSNVTSCAFGGPKRDQLFVTTAVDEKNPTGEPEAGYVFRIDPRTTGVEIATFSGA